MTNSMEKFQETALAGSIIIAQNICNQVIAFQNAISARAEDARFPNATEVNLLVKLINCLDKIRKMFAQSQSRREMNAFIRHLEISDKELGKKVSARYKEYMAQNNPQNEILPGDLEPVTEQPMPVEHPTETNTNIPSAAAEQTTPETQEANATQQPASAPTTEYIIQGETPVTPVDYEKYKYLLTPPFLSKTTNELSHFKGTMRNTNWLQYNLYQYWLPPHERIFFPAETDYHRIINHNKVLEDIRSLYESKYSYITIN